MKQKLLSKKYQSSITTPMAEAVDLAHRYGDLINLSLGDPDITTSSLIIKKAFEDAEKGHTRYTDSLGDPELREEIARYYEDSYGYSVQPNEIMAVVGACHGMHLVLEALLDPGDEVIVPEPYFTPYAHQIKLSGGRMVSLETREEEGFQIDIEELKAAITPRTKAIIINTPNNPTGACMSRASMEALAEVVRSRDLIVIADDVYGAFSFAEPFTPITTIEGMKDRTITISSFSKDYCMTGWRIGYILGPDYLISCIRDINEGVCFSAPSISQRAALYALRSRELIQSQIVEEYKKRVFYAYERLCKIPGMGMGSPKGTIYLFPNIKNTGLTSTQVCRKLLEEAHVLVVPGNAFGQSGEGYIRIACTIGIEKLKEAFDRIERVVI